MLIRRILAYSKSALSICWRELLTALFLPQRLLGNVGFEGAVVYQF